MYDPNLYLTEASILSKYGLKYYSNQEELALQAVVLFCMKNGYDLHLEKEISLQIESFTELMKILPDDVVEIMDIVMDRPHRFYDAEIAYNVYNATSKIPIEELCEEYSQILIALMQYSEPFLSNKCYDYKHTLFLAYSLAYSRCEALDYDERKYPFLRVIPFLSEHTSLNEQTSTIFYEDKLYRYFITQIRNSINYNVYDNKSLTLAQAFELGFADSDDAFFLQSIQILNPDEFNSTFIRFLDRYEGVQVWVPYCAEWQQTLVKDSVIKSCIEECVLSEIVSNGTSSYLILRFDFPCNEVTFKLFDAEILHVGEYPNIPCPLSYERIIVCGYSLNPELYTEPYCPVDMDLVSIGELCDIDSECFEDLMNDPKTYNSLPYYYFSSDLEDIVKNSEIPNKCAISFNKHAYSGPHLHIDCQGNIFINKSPEYYLCPETDNWALRIKDNLVSPEYLAFVLLNSEDFIDFLVTSPSDTLLLKKKIAICKDRKQQDKIVHDYLEKYGSSVASSSAIYKVAVVDPNEQCIIGMSSSWNLNVCKFDFIQGNQGVLMQLERGIYIPDAVIVDAVVDSVGDRYKGLRELLSRLRAIDVPVYVHTDIEEGNLREDLYEEEYQYIMQGRFFKKSESNSLVKLVKNLRIELDKRNIFSAIVLGEFTREFEAIQWADNKVPKLNLESSLTFCMSQPNHAFSSIRAILNGLYISIMKEISNGSGLDNVKNVGILPSLLRDGRYIYNGETIYIIKGNVMPLPLAVALRYATDIVNGAVHEEDVHKMDFRGYLGIVNSDHLAQSVMRILLDFILWLRSVNFEFGGYCVAEDINIIHNVKWSGVLEQVSMDEYSCNTEEAGYVHVNIRSKKEPIKVGEQIVITKVKCETKLCDKYRWITFEWDYKS